MPKSLQFTISNEEGGFPEPSVLLKNAHGTQQAFASVGRFQGAMSCTGFLWKPDGAKPESQALALTNGHCVMPYADRRTSYDVWVKQPASSEWKMIFNYFVDTQAAQKAVGVRTIRYASMKGVDLAVLELDARWNDLEQAGLTPLPQAKKAAAAGTSIRTVGIPIGAFPADEQFLREARCVDETVVSVVEWYWTWFDTHRNSCADIREGSSGSPVLNSEGAVYAILNTTSAGAISDSCYLGNPCEMQRPGAFLVASKNYAIPISALSRCFRDESLTFGSSCPLPPPETVAFANAPPVPSRAADWALQSDANLWKLGPLGEVDCRDEDDYRQGPLPTGALPQDHGIHLLCLQKKGFDERFPSVVVVTIDRQAPKLKPELSLREWADGLSFEPVFQVPELSAFWIGFVPQTGPACDALTLSPYRRIPVRITKKDLPARICVQGEDHAGNRGPIFTYDVQSPDVSKAPAQKAKQHNVIRKQ